MGLGLALGSDCNFLLLVDFVEEVYSEKYRLLVEIPDAIPGPGDTMVVVCAHAAQNAPPSSWGRAKTPSNFGVKKPEHLLIRVPFHVFFFSLFFFLAVFVSFSSAVVFSLSP